MIGDFERYFDAQMNNPTGEVALRVKMLADRMAAGQNIALGCWCAPKRCHGEVIMKRVAYECQKIIDAGKIADDREAKGKDGGAGTKREGPWGVAGAHLPQR